MIPRPILLGGAAMLSLGASGLAGCSAALNLISYDGFAAARGLVDDRATPHTRAEIEAALGPPDAAWDGPDGSVHVQYTAKVLQSTPGKAALTAVIDVYSLGLFEIVAFPDALGRLMFAWRECTMDVWYDASGVIIGRVMPPLRHIDNYL